jgi:hypothetical protein
VTNEGVAEETGEELDERSSAVAYIGRASFRLEHTPVPGNDNRGNGTVQAANHEDTLRIRIPAPSADWQPASTWAQEPELGPELEESPETSSEEMRPALSGIASFLVARLELPRWILATMTFLVFTGGVLVAASVAGGTKAMDAPRASPSVAPAPPALALIPIATAAPENPERAAPAEAPIAARRAAKPAAKQPPARRPRKATTTPPTAQGPRPEAIAGGWVDPFAQ